MELCPVLALENTYTHKIIHCRVTLSELNEWTNRRDSYMRALLGGSTESLALVALDKVSDLLYENEGIARAQAIAQRLGLDLKLANQFIQQLYSSI